MAGLKPPPPQTSASAQPHCPARLSTVQFRCRAQAAGRQPWRDRRSDHPGGRAMGIATVARLFRLRPAGAARAHGRRGLAARRRPSRRHLPANRQAARRRAPLGRRCRSSRLRVSCGERGVCGRVPRRRADFRRPDAGRDPADGQQDRGARGRNRRGRARCSGHGPAFRPMRPSRRLPDRRPALVTR